MKKYLFVWLFFVLISCEKDPAIPVGKGNFVDVITNDVGNIQSTKAVSGIAILNLTGQYAVQERGLCYGLTASPTVADSYMLVGANTETITLSDLIPGQKYYVRSFAKINGIYTYGNQKEFLTNAESSTLSNGLITYLPLNGNSRDYSNSSNHLTGPATKTAGRFGIANTAYLFNGSNNYLTLLLPKNLPTNNAPYSISVWFKANVWNREMAIMGYGPSSASAASNYVKTMPNAGLLHYHWNLDFTITRTIFTNSWRHLVITYDGGTERYYINGQLVANWAHGASPLFVNPSVLSVGARVVNASSNDIKEYFNGSVDELRIYNRTLSASEAYSLYAQ
ncbi:MAG: hypothetical protein RLZZ474_1674 [Bacteroidota bacterium]|jgi:hypothetical protein